MAVFTTLTEQEIGAFLENYALGTLVSAAPIAEGVENTNYRIELRTSCSHFPAVLTVFESRVPEEDLPYYLGLVAHVAANGFPAPQPYPTKQGALFGHVKGKAAAISQWLEGRNNQPADGARLYQLGSMAAKFHVASKDFTGSRVHEFTPFGLQPLAQSCSERLNEIAPDLWEAVQAELAWLDAQKEQASGLPRGHIHADLFPDNVFFDEAGKVSGFIDFYFSAPDVLVYELAVLSNCWCFDAAGQWQPDAWDSLLAGYESERKLEAAEKEILLVLMRASAMRFMLTRAQQWLAPRTELVLKPKDPSEYLAKWQAHQQGKTL